MLKLNYVKERNQMFIILKRKIDFDEMECQLLLNYNKKSQEEELPIIFEYINKFNKLLTEKDNKIKNLEERITQLEKKVEKNSSKKYEENEAIPKNKELQKKNKHLDYSIFKTDCRNLQFKLKICDNILTDGNVYEYFCSFISLKNEYLFVYGTKSYSLEFYDLSKLKIIKIINMHTSKINSVRHYLDDNTKTDLVISSSNDKTINVWECDKYTNIFNIIHEKPIITANIIFLENEMYIVGAGDNDYLNIWDKNKKKIANFGDASITNRRSEIFYLENYSLIIVSGTKGVNIYDFNTKKIFKNFLEINDTSYHFYFHIMYINGILELIDTSNDGCIRIWDFENLKLLKKISHSWLSGLTIWNQNYFFIGSTNKNIILFDLNNYNEIKQYSKHSGRVIQLSKINHPFIGECLITQSEDGCIFIWGE